MHPTYTLFFLTSQALSSCSDSLIAKNYCSISFHGLLEMHSFKILPSQQRDSVLFHSNFTFKKKNEELLFVFDWLSNPIQSSGCNYTGTLNQSYSGLLQIVICIMFGIIVRDWFNSPLILDTMGFTFQSTGHFFPSFLWNYFNQSFLPLVPPLQIWQRTVREVNIENNNKDDPVIEW